MAEAGRAGGLRCLRPSQSWGATSRSDVPPVSPPGACAWRSRSPMASCTKPSSCHARGAGRCTTTQGPCRWAIRPHLRRLSTQASSAAKRPMASAQRTTRRSRRRQHEPTSRRAGDTARSHRTAVLLAAHQSGEQLHCVRAGLTRDPAADRGGCGAVDRAGADEGSLAASAAMSCASCKRRRFGQST